MRRLIVLLLMASTAAPLHARPNDDDRRSERRARAEANSRDDEPRSERQPRYERRSEPRESRSGGDDAGVRPERRSMPDVSREPPERMVRERWSPERPSGVADRRAPSREPDGVSDEAREDGVRTWRGPASVRPRSGDGVSETLRERWAQDRLAREGRWDERRRDRTGSTIPREGTQPPVRVADRDDHRRRPAWRHDWRHDRRYDWRRHRDRNRSIFHIGIYYDPFGWNYRRHNIGWRMWPDYYGRRHWIHDPWMYRLPPTYPGTQWIRYHNDALLVDTWTGEVIDAIYGFFW